MLMSKFYARRKEPEKALKYFERYSALKDSASAGLTLLRESDVIQQFANFEKQYQINYLTGNNRQQRFYLTVAAIVGTMAVVIILLIARNWQRSKREVRIVNKLNAQITRQKISLEQTLTELSENSKEKDRILRTVAHDLRNPIGGIASLTAIMVNEDDYTPEQKELLKLIKETATDTIELINEILEATRGSEAELSRQMVDINSLLGNTVELMRFKAAEKNQQITVSLLDKPEAIFIDREKIRRVVSNLISNAIKFSTLNSVINVKVIDKGVYIEISVPDHGIGIPLNMQDKIFNIFTEAKRPGTMGEKSFGLGLSICRQIIEKHNGKIWFESHQLTGTTFFINLEKTEENMIETQTAIMRESAF
jgi:signal transduction histidine kinase